MEGDIEAAGDAVTGAVIGHAVAARPAGLPTAADTSHGACRNCGAVLTGSYCAACGQRGHIHRSFFSLVHEIVHGVFHFEGRIWHTIPELIFRPGVLTRRYIDGERAKFVSPMALFLFTVFLMFAVFSFTSSAFVGEAEQAAGTAAADFQRGNANAIEATTRQIEALQKELQAPDLAAPKRVDIERQIAGLEASHKVMQTLSDGDLQRLGELSPAKKTATSNVTVVTGSGELDRKLNGRLRQAFDNPRLLLYKVKVNSYKFSWALIPLSVPFLWILFFWRRDVYIYDHAIFVTYSISFMMLFLIVLAIAGALGAPRSLLASVFGIAAPLHLYKQLQHAYGLSRLGAGIRAFLLSIFGSLILSAFIALLFVLGALG